MKFDVCAERERNKSVNVCVDVDQLVQLEPTHRACCRKTPKAEAGGRSQVQKGGKAVVIICIDLGR